MPFVSKYTKPKAIITGEVWHTYIDDSYETPSIFWYTTDADSTCTNAGASQFDIRKLATYPKSNIAYAPTPEDKKNHKKIIQSAIDRGFLVLPKKAEKVVTAEEQEEKHPLVQDAKILMQHTSGWETMKSYMYVPPDTEEREAEAKDKVRLLAERYGVTTEKFEEQFGRTWKSLL